MLFSLLVLPIIALLPRSTTAACYFPNGTRQTSSEYLPCSSVQDEVSMCCALNRTNPSGTSVDTGFTRDVCLPNGICQNNYLDADDVLKTSYWRESCSNQGWGTGCLDEICANGTDGGSDSQITPCGATTSTTQWCCGFNNTACCSVWPNDPQAVTLALNIQEVASSSSLASSLPSTSTLSLSTSSTQPQPSSSASSTSPADSSSLSTGAKAGIGVGVGLGAVLLLGIGIFFMRRSRTRSKRLEGLQGATMPEMPVSGTAAKVYPSEMMDSRRDLPSELDSRSKLPPELPGDQPR